MRGLIFKILIVFLVPMNFMFGADNLAIPFELVNGLIIVEAEIDGHSNNFIVDSGANGILLNGQSIESNISYATLSGALDGSEKSIDKLVVGDFEWLDLQGFSTDLSGLEAYLDRSIGGILGASIFVSHSIVIDYVDSHILIFEHGFGEEVTSDLSVIDFEVVYDLPVAKIDIDGHTYSFIIDSGASTNFIDQKLISDKAHHFSETGISKSIYTAAGKEFISQEYIFTGINLGESSIYEMEAYAKDFALLSAEMDMEISGLISLSKLSPHKILFDVKNRKLYF